MVCQDSFIIAKTWLRMQFAYDLAVACKDESKIKVKRQQVPQELQM
jgi:hypothetical protein